MQLKRPSSGGGHSDMQNSSIYWFVDVYFESRQIGSHKQAVPESRSKPASHSRWRGFTRVIGRDSGGQEEPGGFANLTTKANDAIELKMSSGDTGVSCLAAGRNRTQLADAGKHFVHPAAVL